MDGRHRVDVLIIGMGAAGALAAHVLCDAGARVVAVDAGGWGPTGDGWFDHSRPTVRRHSAETARPDVRGVSMANAVGGSKHLSANQSYRLAARTLADWPVSAAELARYHDLVERLHGVESSPPAPWTDLMASAARRLGWSPFPAPLATGPPIGRPLLAPALDSGRLTVYTQTIALRLTVDRAGRVDGAKVWHAGRERQLRAPRVILAAYVFETVRLLLLSRSATHPWGIGNAHGQLGRHFATHSFVAVYGVFPGSDLGRAAGRPGQAVAVGDFEAGPDVVGGDPDPARHRFVGGSILQASMGTEPVPIELGGPGTVDPRAVGRVWAQPEQLTRAEHLVDLDPTHLDALGRPVLRVTHDLALDDLCRSRYLQDRLAQWLQEAGAKRVWREPIAPQSVSPHAYGGARMGNDPRTSVVNDHGHVHDAPNVIVLGASTFPSTGGRGPTQTVEALAWRSAEEITRSDW
jgi:gluconate 2-dehydrogenase alpha chain